MRIPQLVVAVVCGFAFIMPVAGQPSRPSSDNPPPITVAALSKLAAPGVSIHEVSDYVFGNYTGGFTSPPSADGNPRKAFIVTWHDRPYRFVFSHEGSYCPWIELSNGSAECFQFFEGNDGWAELFNQFGRLEKNSFIQVLDPGPKQVHVRWDYFGVNEKTGERAYHGVEDFYCLANGLILRRQSYKTLMPGQHHGHTREPIETIGMCPVGKLWKDMLQTDDKTGERHALAAIDPFSEKRYDVYWKPKPNTLWEATPRREGCSWKDIDDANGVALVVPMKAGSIFCAFGAASGYEPKGTHIKDHSFVDTGGIGWISSCWDHWPIGWLNSQAHPVDAESLKKYPNHFSPSGMDFFLMKNEDVEKGEYWSIMGVGTKDMEPIRHVTRAWLDLAEGTKDPAKVAALPSLDAGSSSGQALPAAHVTAKEFKSASIYHSPQSPGYTAWCTLWRSPTDELRMAFQQVTGPVKDWAKRKNVTLIMGSADEGATWKTIREVPARSVVDSPEVRTYAEPVSSSFCGHGMAVLKDGTLVTDLWANADEKSGYIQRSTDEGRTWSAPIYLRDPEIYKTYPTQIRPLRDGRLVLVAGTVKQADVKTAKYLLKEFFESRDDGKTWSHLWTMPADVGLCEESDFVELDNGDLLFIHRAEHYQGDKYITSNRLQNIFHRKGDAWEIGPCTAVPMPHSGFPELLKTREGSILHIGTDGIWQTGPDLYTWTRLALPGSPYYPRATQLKDGRILVVGHVGGDDEYGKVNQTIVAQTFRLDVQR